MKNLLCEIRLLIAEWLLWKAFQVAPFGKEGEQIKVTIAYYLDAKSKEMKERIKHN